MPAGPRCAASRSISSPSGGWRSSTVRLGTWGRKMRQRPPGSGNIGSGAAVRAKMWKRSRRSGGSINVSAMSQSCP
jgi:hypothetical protein